MDKYEYKVRSQEIRNLIAEGEYTEAAEIADTIDWRRVKSVMMLCTISDLYKINRRFEESKELLLLAYERHPGGRTIIYSLCELSIKMGEFVQAIEYYKEFVQVAPKDTGRYILQYKLYVAQEVSLEERIEVLEELKKRDYREKWAYELAYLYHRVGLSTRCVEECDELILWFGEGKYVTKAMELKMLHQPLTPEQEAKYAGRFEEYKAEQEAVQNAPSLPVDEDNPIDVMTAPTVEISGGELEDIQVKTMDVGEYNTINLQKELADSMKDLWENVPAGQQPSVVTEEYFSSETGELSAEGFEQEEVQEDASEMPVYSEGISEEEILEEEIPEEEIPEEITSEESEDLSNTQRITRAIVAPLFQDTDDMTEVAYQLEEEPAEGLLQEAEVEPEESPADAAQVQESQEEESQAQEFQEAESQAPELQKPESQIEEPAGIENPQIPQTPEDTIGKKSDIDDTASKVLAKMQEEIAPRQTLKRPAAFDKYLGMEYDGQMSFVVPESDKVEKQITGQLKIEDILAEWERMKKENEEKCAEEVRQLVLQHTGNILVDFDQAVKDGLLEKLENSDDTDMPEEAASEEEMPEDVEEYGEAEELEEIEEQCSEGDGEEEVLEEVKEEPEKTEESVPTEMKEEGQAIEESMEPEEFVESMEPEESVESMEPEESVESIEPEEPAEPVEPTMESVENSGEIPTEETKTVSESGIRELTREEKELYASFIQNRKSKEQLIKAIDSVSLAAYTGNIIITGEEGMDTMTLAKNMMKEVQMTDSNFSGKIAKISGSSMNQRDLNKILDKLNNGALIVENAGKMNEETGEHLYKALQQENMGIIVILEGTRKSVNKLLDAVPALNDSFNARIDIEALDNDTLVAFAKKYALEHEYSIDEMGLLALHTRISDRQTSDHAVTLLEVKEMMDDAIDHANRKTLGHFFDVLFAKRYDEEDMIILRENDFV